MRRADLEHIIRASADITGCREFVIIGSQAILGTILDPPVELVVSMEADIYPLENPDLAMKIEGAIGEGSHFQTTHGYYAQGVGPETAIVPADWRTRVERVQNENTNHNTGYCLGVEDLFLSKAFAGRPKDRKFCQVMLKHEYVEVGRLLELEELMSLSKEQSRTLRATVRRWAQQLNHESQAEELQMWLNAAAGAGPTSCPKVILIGLITASSKLLNGAQFATFESILKGLDLPKFSPDVLIALVRTSFGVRDNIEGWRPAVLAIAQEFDRRGADTKSLLSGLLEA